MTSLLPDARRSSHAAASHSAAGNNRAGGYPAGYGAGHRREISDERCESVLNAVLDAGINYIDTADDYGNSEELLGKFIGHRRSEYYLATKCGGPAAGERHDWTRENVFRNLHNSLRRLKVDCLDVMQLQQCARRCLRAVWSR